MPHNNHIPDPRALAERRKHLWLRRLLKVIFAGMIDMDFANVRRHVILLEILAFELILLFIWLGEFLDFSHRLYGAPPSSFDWQLSLMLSVWVLLVMGFVIAITFVFFKQIRYLEGFLPVCSFCKKIRLEDGAWVPLEEFMQARTSVQMTHSLCPPCAKEHYGYEEEG